MSSGKIRDILSDLGPENYLSDPDPVRRAQIQMKSPLPKRFYKAVTVSALDQGFAVYLDGKPVQTPGKSLLLLPTEKAASLVGDEFAAQGDVIDPVTMPVLRLVNTVIDGVATDPQSVLEDILRFASTDLLCYRADLPQGLVDRQNTHWDPVLDWMEQQFGVRFNLAEGVIHVEQPRETIAIVGSHLKQRIEPLRLGSIHVMTALTGSALLALAVEAGELDPEAAWSAAHVDEDWQIEQWGQDAEAAARRNHRERDMMAAVALLMALDEPRK